MGKISYKTIMKNTALTDFADFKELVISNAIREIPSKLKNENTDTNLPLDFFY